MGRRIRVEYAGATYHVYSRGNRRAPVFRAPEEYEAYLEDLARLSKQHGIAVLAFCLMSNHPHLCLCAQEGGDPLSALMQRLNLRHVQRYNRRHHVRGHLNESRYRAQVVESDRYLLTLVRYIHNNPVKARMVERMEEWVYSSHRAYQGMGYPWVETGPVLELAGGADGYGKWMEMKLKPEERQMFLPDLRGRLRPVVGEWTGRAMGERQFNPWARRSRPPIDQAAEELVELLGLRIPELRSESREARLRNGRRNLAQVLRGKGYRLHEIGTVLGREEAAVSRLLLRARGCAEAEAEYLPSAAAEVAVFT